MKRRSTIVCLALLAFQSAFCQMDVEKQKIFYDTDDRISSEKSSGGVESMWQYNPGVKVRLAKGLTDLVRENLLEYGNAYLNFDYKFKPSGTYKLKLFPFYMDINFQNFRHDPISFNMTNFMFDFTNAERSKDKQVLKIVLPLVRYFEMEFDYSYNFLGLVYKGGHLQYVSNFTWVEAELELTTTSKGHIYPKLNSFYLDFGRSEIYEPNSPLSQFIYRQQYHLFKHLVMSAVNQFGPNIFNSILPEYTRHLLSNQEYFFHHNLYQLNKTGQFNINWRFLTDPIIHNNVLDFDMLFDIGAGANSCKRPFTNQTLGFQNDFNSKYVQMIVNDRVINCIIDAMLDQSWGKVTLNSDMMKKSFGTHLLPITARTVADAYPQIADVYGINQELDIELELWRSTFSFGPDSGNDCRLRIGVKMGIKRHGDLNYIVYDEMEFLTEFNLDLKAEVMYATFVQMSLTPTPFSRRYPIFTTLKLDNNDYADFWDYADMRVNQMLSFLNDDVFGVGVPLPFWKLSFLTNFKFTPHNMGIVSELYYNK